MKKSLLALSVILAGCNTNPSMVSDFDNDSDFDTRSDSEILELVDAYTCYGLFDYDKKGEPVYLVSFIDEPELGVVEVNGYLNYGVIESKGIDRRWYYDCHDSGCDSMIRLRPNGSAYFYDFTDKDTATGEFPMKCEYDDIATREYNEYFTNEGLQERPEYKQAVETEIKL